MLGDDDEIPDDIDEDILSEVSLRKISGCENLNAVTCLELTVDTHDRTISALGELLPNLVQLRLSNSSIASIRDLGTSLEKLEILWMARCGLKEVDGISLLVALKELYLAFNDVSDLGPLCGLENLQVLDLDSNNVGDIAQLRFLSQLPLVSLTLESNPVEQITDFRARVAEILPRLQSLDDLPFAPSAPSVSPAGAASAAVAAAGHEKARSEDPPAVRGRPLPAEGDRAQVRDALLDIDLVVQGIKKAKHMEIPTHLLEQAKASIGSAVRSSMQRPRTAIGGRQEAPFLRASAPGLSRAFRSSLVSSGSSAAGAGADAEPADAASELTTGGDVIVCGNPALALKARRVAKITSLDNANAILDHVKSAQLVEARTLLTAAAVSPSAAQLRASVGRIPSAAAASGQPVDRGSIPISVAALSRPASAAGERPQRPSTALGVRGSSFAHRGADGLPLMRSSIMQKAALDEQEQRFRELASRVLAPDAIRSPGPGSPSSPPGVAAAPAGSVDALQSPPFGSPKARFALSGAAPRASRSDEFADGLMPPPPPHTLRRRGPSPVAGGSPAAQPSPAMCTSARPGALLARSTSASSDAVLDDESDILRASGHGRLAAAAAAVTAAAAPAAGLPTPPVGPSPPPCPPAGLPRRPPSNAVVPAGLSRPPPRYPSASGTHAGAAGSRDAASLGDGDCDEVLTDEHVPRPSGSPTPTGRRNRSTAAAPSRSSSSPPPPGEGHAAPFVLPMPPPAVAGPPLLKARPLLRSSSPRAPTLRGNSPLRAFPLRPGAQSPSEPARAQGT